MTYVVITDQTYQTDTPQQIAAAQAALREADLDSAPVWTSPFDSVEALEAAEMGDPEAYENGQVLFAQ